MRFYLAGRFIRREEFEKDVIPILQSAGWTPRCRWVFGGEDGLTRSDIALLDLEDVNEAECIILVTEPYETYVPGGGRFVEFGYALAKGKKCFVVGEYENVFTHHPDVKVYPTFQDLIRDNETV